MSTVTETAARILDEGSRPIIKDNYEARLDYFAQEMAGKDRSFQAQVIMEIMRQDNGAFESWLKSNRLDDLVNEGLVTQQERDDLVAGFAYGVQNGIIAAEHVPGAFVRDAHNPDLTAGYIRSQDLNDRDGFRNAVAAFSGLPPEQMSTFINDPANAATIQRFELAVQQHQDWYETQTMDFWTGGEYPQHIEGDVQFSVEQLQAMREAFRTDDGFLTNGELLLAYPDRAERNERVTQQYYDLSTKMSGIVGDDNANWATFAVWASDEIGRNLDGTTGIELGEAAFGDPRFWLSKGNSMLISDIGPGFQYFTQTFANGQNRDMTFEQFWSNFRQEYGGRNISYLDGSGDPENDMKNAFKAYYEAMQLHDQEQAATDPTQQAELADRRADLMLYANTLVGLQEQEIVQGDIENGMDTALGVNFWGLASGWIDFHLPQTTIHTDQDIPQQAGPVDPAGTTFTTVDGQVIQLDQALRDRLNSLPGNIDGDGDEYDIANSGTDHWEGYGERMGSIYHLFANFQQDGALFGNPRDVFGTRAEPLENDPQYPP
jgi:hypothetical protein